jgi:signal transduction histidine kinase
LNKLVDELLELAKLESDEICLNCEVFNLSELLLDVAQKFQLKAKEKGIDLATHVSPDLPFVNADIGLIERVLENLIENAINYTPEGGSVSLNLTLEDQNISIQISDTGYGIPEGELPYIFNRFYQLDQSRKNESGHSGLGLAITKKILELHGRSIEVRSVLNSGTTFAFRLPVNKPA